jgi:integrase/recombinase XerC
MARSRAKAPAAIASPALGEISLPPLAEAYVKRLAHARRYSPHTLAAYRRDLMVLARDTCDLAALTASDLRQKLAEMHRTDLGPRSLARVLSTWRGFYNDLIRQRVVTVSPCQGLKAPKAPKRLPETLSPDAASALVSAFEHSQDWEDVRDRAVFELTYSSGLRVSEVVGLNLDDLSLTAREVRVLGKGQKTRLVPVGQAAIEALQSWLNVRQNHATTAPACPALFTTPQGKRLTVGRVQKRIKVWAQEAGIDHNVYPHMLRHSFASHVLQSSGDLRAVQEMLGHASIASTQVYTHLDFQHLAKVYDAAHPRAKRGRNLA